MKTTKLSPDQALILTVSVLALASLACSAIVRTTPAFTQSPPEVEVFASDLGKVYGLAFDGDGYLFATGTRGDKSVLWKIGQVGAKEVFAEITDQGDVLSEAGFASHSRHLANVAVDGRGNIWITSLQHGACFVVSKDNEVSKVYLNSQMSISFQEDAHYPEGVAWDDDGHQLYIITSGPASAYSIDNVHHIKTLTMDSFDRNPAQEIHEIRDSGGYSVKVIDNDGIPIRESGDGLLKARNSPLYFIGQNALYEVQPNGELSMVGEELKDMILGGAAIDDQGEIYLSVNAKRSNLEDKASGNGMVLKMNREGKRGVFLKEVAEPLGMAFRDGYLYIADRSTGNILRVKGDNIPLGTPADTAKAADSTPISNQPPPTNAPVPTASARPPAGTPVPSTNTPVPTLIVPSVTVSPTVGMPTSALRAGSWQPILDLPRYINTLVVDPMNPQVLYAGTGDYAGSGSGVYKSEDAGLTWHSASVGLPNQEVLALTFSYDEPSMLYAAVGSEIFASADGAESWTRLGDTGFFGINGCLLRGDPGNRNVLFAVAQSDGIARSNDGGYTWLPVGEGLPGDEHSVYAMSLAIDPTDTNVIYVGTGGFVGGGHGVYKSTDGGETFSPANQEMVDYRITALAVDPAYPQTVYAGGDSGELFKSADGGQTWSNLTQKLPTRESDHPTIRDIVMDPIAPETIYLLADNAGILVSDNGGGRWRPLGKPAGPDYLSFTAMTAIFGLQPEPILVVGVEREGGWRYDVTQPVPTPTAAVPSVSEPTEPSLPAGRWKPVSDLPRQINALVVDPTNPYVFYAGTGASGSGSGVYKSEDGGLSWHLAMAGLPGQDVLALAISREVPPTLYSAVGSDVFASVDGAQSWTRLGDSGIISGFYRQMYIAPGDRDVLFMVIRPGGVIRSTDGGYTWLPVGEGLPGDEHEVYVLSLAIDPTDPNVIYAGSGGWVGGGHGVYKSTDGGETFSPANRGMLDYRISALAVDPAQSQTVYAGGDFGELFKSTDGGQTWIELTDKLQVQRYSEPRTIRAIILDPSAPETIYLLGDNSGVLFSSDGGAKWRPLGKPGERDQPVFTTMIIAFTPEPVLVVSLEDEGVWRCE